MGGDEQTTELMLMKVTAVPIVSALGQDEEEEDLEVLVRVEVPLQQVVANKHPPIDLVAVVDVSGSMGYLPDQNIKCEKGEQSRMDYLKAALRFIVNELHDDDRLSIIQFNKSIKDSSPLSPISGGGRELARKLVDSLIPHGGTAFKPALEEAVRILQDRDEESSSRRVPFIVFLSDGEESDGSTKTQWEQVIKADSNHPLQGVLRKYPVHTFGFSNFHDPMALLAIARVSCGTYSYIDGQGLDKITDAFAVCLGGLTTVVVKDATIALSAAPGVTIVGIDAGGYDKGIKEDGASGEVRIPVLYEREVKNFIVHLRIPRAEAAEEEQLLLTAGGTYIDAAAGHGASTATVGEDNHHQLSIQRPAAGDDDGDGQQRDEAVLEQVTRFKLLSLLETKLLPEGKELKNKGANWAQWLRKNWNELKNSSGLSTSSFDKDVEVMAGKLEQGSGQAYVCSYVSSHQMECATTMGSPENIAPKYKTPAITRKAKKAAAQKTLEAPAATENGGGDGAASAKPHPAEAPVVADAQVPPRSWKEWLSESWVSMTSTSIGARSSCCLVLGIAGVVLALLVLMLLRLLNPHIVGPTTLVFDNNVTAALDVVNHPQWPAMKNSVSVILQSAKEDTIISFFEDAKQSDMSQKIDQYLYMAILYAAALRARYSSTAASVPEKEVRNHAQVYLQGMLNRINKNDALPALQVDSEHNITTAMSQQLYSTIVQAQVLVTKHRPPYDNATIITNMNETINEHQQKITEQNNHIATLNTEIETLNTEKATMSTEIVTLKIEIEKMQNCCQLAKRCEQHVKELGGSVDYFEDYVTKTTYSFEFERKELSAHQAVEHGRQKIKELQGAVEHNKVDGLY